MKTNIRLLLLLVITLKAIPAFGQDKFHVHLDYNYLLGLRETGDLWTIKSGLNGFDLNVTGMYDIHKRLSAGIGIGLEKLYDPSYTIFPIYTKIMYSPIKSTDKPYVFTKLGYGIGTGTSNAGLLFNIGVGYKVPLRNRFGFNFMLGYHLQSIRYDVLYNSEEGMVIDKMKDSNKRHSFSFGIGFIF